MSKTYCTKTQKDLISSTYHVHHSRGLFKSYDDLQTLLYSILDLMVTFGVSTKIWPLSQVTPLFTKMPNPPIMSQSQAHTKQIDLLWIYYSSSYYTHFSLFTVQLSLLLKILSYPGNLAKSNSKDLWTSLVSSLELHSNKSLCQESDILLIH